jgi:CHASE3 domain sensor protein
MTALAGSPTVAGQRIGRFRTVNTSGVIGVLGAAVILLAIVAGVVLAAVSGSVRDGLTVIGHQAAPQVTATEDLSFALADMDARLTNVLLVGADPDLATFRAENLGTYELRRGQADAALQQASVVAGANPTAQRIVREVLDQLGTYQAVAAQAMLRSDQEHNPAGRPSSSVLDLYRHATDLMSATLRTAHRLTEINSGLLNQSYEDKRGVTVTARWWLVILGGSLIVALVGLQVVLRFRLRRRINPALLLASILAGWLVIGGIAVLATESEHLRVAKQDAFDSLFALRQARTVSYDANADESRYLMDPDRAAQYQQAFLDKTQLSAGVQANDIRFYIAALDERVVSYHADNTNVRITGYFGTELNNITFPGERAAVDQLLAVLQNYHRDDSTMRAQVARGDLLAAIKFCTSMAPGDSSYYFSAYDTALATLIDINQHAFDASILDGETAIGPWTGLFPYGTAALIAILVVIGLWPRLAEYR